MLHHVSIGVRDVERAAGFYDPVLGALGYSRVMEFLPHAIAYGENKDHPEFWIQIPVSKQMATQGEGTHVGFSASSREAVDAFHSEALKAGGSNGGEPGPRPDYGPEYYGAFIYDLDGNKIEATLNVLVSDEAALVAARQERREGKKAKRKKRKQNRKKKAAAGNKKKGKKKKKKGKKARGK